MLLHMYMKPNTAFEVLEFLDCQNAPIEFGAQHSRYREYLQFSIRRECISKVLASFSQKNQLEGTVTTMMENCLQFSWPFKVLKILPMGKLYFLRTPMLPSNLQLQD